MNTFRQVYIQTKESPQKIHQGRLTRGNSELTLQGKENPKKMWVLITTVFLCRIVEGNYPVFDYTTRMRILLIPADVRPGSVIYRLRGTDADYDYPLKFDVAGN